MTRFEKLAKAIASGIHDDPAVCRAIEPAVVSTLEAELKRYVRPWGVDPDSFVHWMRSEDNKPPHEG